MSLEELKIHIKENDIDAAKALIDTNKYLDVIDAETGQNAFHIAASNNATEILEYLIISNIKNLFPHFFRHLFYFLYFHIKKTFIL